MKKQLFGGLLVFLISIDGNLGSQAQAATEVLFNSFPPPKANPRAKVLDPWVKDLNALKGDFRFKVPPKNLAPPPRQMDIVTQGIADGAFIFNAFLRKRIPHVQLSLLPMTTTTAEADGVALWRTYNKFFKPKKPFKDVVLLGFFSAPGGHLVSMKAPIRSAADLRKMKIWSLPGFPALTLKRLGAAVVPGPAVRIYPIVSKGTVDGFSGLDIGDIYAFRVAQFAKSMTEIPGALFSASFSVFLSKRKWGELSADAKRSIRSMSGEKIARRSKGWDNAFTAAGKRFRGEGKKILEASPEFVAAFRKAVQPLHAGWIAEVGKLGIDGKAALAFYRAEAKKISGMK